MMLMATQSSRWGMFQSTSSGASGTAGNVIVELSIQIVKRNKVHMYPAKHQWKSIIKHIEKGIDRGQTCDAQAIVTNNRSWGQHERVIMDEYTTHGMKKRTWWLFTQKTPPCWPILMAHAYRPPCSRPKWLHSSGFQNVFNFKFWQNVTCNNKVNSCTSELTSHFEKTIK